MVDVCVDMQTRVVSLSKRFLAEMNRNYYVTPTSYLELINTFKNLLNVQRQEVYIYVFVYMCVCLQLLIFVTIDYWLFLLEHCHYIDVFIILI